MSSGAAKRPGLQTRASNATKHPGKVVTDQIIHRRSHSEVIAEREATEKAKAAEAAEQLKRIQTAAAIRFRLEQEMALETRRRSTRSTSQAAVRSNPEISANSRETYPDELKAKERKPSKKAAISVKESDGGHPETGVEKGKKVPSTKVKATIKKANQKSVDVPEQPEAPPAPSSPLSVLDDLPEAEEELHKIGKTKGTKRKHNLNNDEADSREENPFDENNEQPAHPSHNLKLDEATPEDESEAKADEPEKMEVDDHDGEVSPGVKRPSKKKRKHNGAEMFKEQLAMLRQQNMDADSAVTEGSVATSTMELPQGKNAAATNALAKENGAGNARKDVTNERSRTAQLQGGKQAQGEGVARKQGEDLASTNTSDGVNVLANDAAEIPRSVASTHNSNGPSKFVSQLGAQESRGRAISRTPARAGSRRPSNTFGTPHPDEALEPRTPCFTRGSPIYNRPRQNMAGLVVEKPGERGPQDQTPNAKVVGSNSGGPSSSGSAAFKFVNLIEATPQRGDNALSSHEAELHRETKSMKVTVVADSKDVSTDFLEVKKERRARSTSSSRSKAQLPCGVGESDAKDKKWSNVFIATFFSYLGTLSDPWHPIPRETVKVLQLIWDTVYPDRPHRIETTSDAIYTISRQRSYEWRNKFLSQAQSYIEAVIKKNDWTTRDDQVHIRDYVGKMLGDGYPFISKHPDDPKAKGPFQSEFVATVFSCHLHAVKNAIKVRSVPLTATHNPVGALTLASLACHRALATYSTGASKYLGKFSNESMASETGYYSQSILKLGAKTWTKIVDEGAKFVPSGVRRSSAAEVVVIAPVEQRALIEDDEDSD